MNELATLPTSIRQRLEQADSLMRQDRPDEAETVLRQAGIEMARTAPELCALLMLASLGQSGFSIRTVEVKDTMERVEYKVFGISFGEGWAPVSTRTESLREFRIIR